MSLLDARRPGRGRLAAASLVVMSLLLVTLDLQGGAPAAPARGFRAATRAVITPVQGMLGAVFRPVVNLVDALGNLGSLRSENDSLREELAALRDLETRVLELERENEELLALQNLTLPFQFETVSARVSAYGASNFDATFVIDVGTNAGVHPDMPVVSAAGLVGHVIDAGPATSRVLLISSPDSGVAVKIAGSEDAGTVTGQGTDQPLALRIIDAREPVEPGQRIITSGFDPRALYPPGLTVGAVADVVDSGSLALVTGTVVAAANLDSVSLVRVLLWSSGSALPDPTETTTIGTTTTLPQDGTGPVGTGGS
jgi:rod shape-determining protein MreC